MLSMGLPKVRAIFKANTAEGTYLHDSMALIVCRLTPTASANCCCVMRTMARSTLILFFIALVSESVQLNLELDGEYQRYAEQINPGEGQEIAAI